MNLNIFIFNIQIKGLKLMKINSKTDKVLEFLVRKRYELELGEGFESESYCNEQVGKV